MSQACFDLSSRKRTSFDDGNYVYELYNRDGKLMIDIRSNNSRIRKAKPIEITVPDTIDYCINLYRCFLNHRHLDDISALRSLDTSHVTNMGEMFRGCRKLRDYNALSSWDVSNVATMAGMFHGCYKLRDYSVLSSWDVSNVIDMCWMFYNCAFNHDDDLRPLSNWNVHEECVLSGFRSNELSFYRRGENSPIIDLPAWNNRNIYPREADRIRDTSPQWLLDRDAAQRERHT